MTDLAPDRHPAFAAAVFAGGIALMTILGAWGFELIGHYVPCKLCLQERIPYYVGVPVLALAAVLALRGAFAPSRILLVLGALIFLAGAGLGAYHAGAEWGWWPGPSDCGDTGAGRVDSVADLAAQLRNIRIVSCTEATWRFLGLSFAGWNAVMSLIVAALALAGATRKAA